MDSLVAQYRRPMFDNEYNQDDQQELYDSTPSLSLKFAMPPVAQVRHLVLMFCSGIYLSWASPWTDMISIAIRLAPCRH